MIEFKVKDFDSEDWHVGTWKKVENFRVRSIHDFDFSYMDYRIDGITYESQTEGFKEAYRNEQLWAQLKRK